MFQEEFNKIVSDHNQLLEFELADVRSICERYPYCQVAQVLYAKKLHLINNPQFENQLKKAATNIYDRTILYKFVEKTILSRTVAAGFEEESESRETIIEPERNHHFQNNDIEPEIELEITPVQLEENIEASTQILHEEIISATIDDATTNLEINEAPVIEIVPEIETFAPIEEKLIDIESPDQQTDEDHGEDLEEQILEDTIEGIPELITEEELIQAEMNDDNIEGQFIQPTSVLEEFILNNLMDEEEMELPEEEEVAALYGEVKSEELPIPVINFATEPNDIDEIDNEIFQTEEEVIEQIEQPVEEEVVEVLSVQETEEILKTIMEGIPELEMDLQIALDSNNKEEEPDEAILAEEQAINNLNESIINEESLEFDAEIENEDGKAEKLIDPDTEELQESEEPIFDMPAYDIDRELGALREEDKIKINILIPEEKEYVPEKNYADSFIGWINRLSGESKGREVLMRESNKPIRIYKKPNDQNNEMQQEVRQEKVINEIIAADLARKSLEANDNLATETYARILVMQGKYSKAIEMYSKLSLLKPQKSDYFAALIDQIKKELNKMLFTIIIIVAIIVAVFLGLIVLVQNPKGGGLTGTFGGAANQIFGYKRTTDDIERITWGLVVIVFALCLSSAALQPTETQATQNGFGPEAKPPAPSMQVQPQTEDPGLNTDPSIDGATQDPEPAKED